MTMNLKSAFLTVAVFLFAAAEGHANIVQNGGFEAGFTDWSVITGAYGAAPGASTHDPFAGSYAAEFSSGNQSGFYQDLTTEIGTTYVVSFYLATWNYPYNTTSGATTVSWDGETLASISTGSIMDYQFYSYTYTATSTTSRLEFHGNNALGFTEIDNVGASAVPEPLSYGMSAAGIALCALLCRARRRREAASAS